MTSRVAYQEVLADACRAAGADLTEDRQLIIEDLAQRRAQRMARIVTEVEPEVLDLLRGLRDRGLRLAVISNCAVEEVSAWSSSPLAPLIDAAVFSCEAGYAKPDAAIYLDACDRLEVAPSGAWYVGDGDGQELHGAARVGMRPWAARWFTDRWDEAGRAAAAARTRGYAGLAEPRSLVTALDDSTAK
jgi:FMN phosphatase YigB (HAD superfamily)